MRLILAEPQTLVRAALKQLLQTMQGVDVIGEAEDGRQLLEQVAAHRPELVVSEFTLPDISGSDLAHQIRRHYPGTGLIFLSSSADSGHVRVAMKSGASAFLTKCSEPIEVELAMRACGKGQIYLSPSVSRRDIEGRRAERPDGSAVLTRRQREVLRLIGRGKSTKEIAQVMGVGAKTVETHRARLMQALGLRGIGALTHFAVRHGPAATD
ncbi:MAG: response regulator transcription factor [Nevskiales bacterium]